MPLHCSDLSTNFRVIGVRAFRAIGEFQTVDRLLEAVDPLVGMMMMIAFITFNSSLVPLIEVAQIHGNLSFGLDGLEPTTKE